MPFYHDNFYFDFLCIYLYVKVFIKKITQT